jgi:hypothetical protein
MLRRTPYYSRLSRINEELISPLAPKPMCAS